MIKQLRLFSTLLLLAVASLAWGQTTYKLKQVTSVKSGELYVFEQDGYVMNNIVSSKALQTTNTYNNTGLSGTESYIWKLETSGSGFYLRNASLGTSNNYLYNSGSSTEVSLSNNKTTWVFTFQDDGTVVMQQSDTNGRFLGYSTATSYAYKAYAISNLSSYPHAIKVYQLVEDSGETPTLEDNDLALSGSTALTFDLYNNSSAQDVNFTTSSSGAITVEQSEYITTSVSGNTITVTPVKVTPETQTITVSQAEDETYAAGTATFTVTITDSTPIVATNWQKTSLADLSANDIFVIVGNNGENYALANDNGASAAPTAVSVTVSGDYLKGTVADNIKWNVSGNPTDGYTFYPNGSTTTWLYCTNTNNGVRVGSNDNNSFKISEEGYLLHDGTSRYVGIYSSQDWRCYTSINDNIKKQTFAFYKYIGAPEPTISANDVEIANDVTSGSINYTISNPVGETPLTAEVTNGNWLTLGTVTESSVPFTCSANETTEPRTATVTLTYGDVTKDVTITQAAAPAALKTIAEVRTQVTGNVTTKGVVTSCVGKNAYIQDATAAICVYGKELTVGNEIQVSGTLSTFNGLLEITNPEFTVLSQDNTVNPEVMTIAQVNASTNQGWLVKIENATVTAINDRNTTIAQGENSVVVRDIPSDVDYKVYDVLTLTGNIGYFNEVQIANPTNVEVQASQTPAIETANKVELAYDATFGEIAYTINNPVEGAVLAATTDAEWISNITVGTDKVTFTTTTNEGSEDRTANITLAYTGADNIVVTVTQGHFVVDYATLPFNYDGNGSDANSVDGLTATDIENYNSSPAMKFDGTGDCLVLKFNERPGVLTFNIKGNAFEKGTFTVQTSEDGETYTELATYTELGAVQSEEFDALGENVRYIKWIYTEKVSGNVALGNIVLKKYETPKIDPELSFNEQEVTVTIEDTFTGLTLNNKFSVSPITYSSSNENVATVNETGVVEIAGTGKTTITASFAGNDTYKTSSASYMLTVAKKPAEGDVKFEIVTPNDELTDGEYLIVYPDETMALAFDGSLETLDAASNTQVVTIVNNSIMTTNAIAFTIAAKEGGYSIKSASGLYIGNTSNANALKTSATDDYVNTITINEDGNADIVSSNSYMRYNATNNQDRFRYYNSGSYTNQKAIKLYRKVADSENKKGDVNNDGSVTIADVTALVNIILGKSENYDSKVADVNEDGSITIADVTSLVNIILGKTN